LICFSFSSNNLKLSNIDIVSHTINDLGVCMCIDGQMLKMQDSFSFLKNTLNPEIKVEHFGMVIRHVLMCLSILTGILFIHTSVVSESICI